VSSLVGRFRLEDEASVQPPSVTSATSERRVKAKRAGASVHTLPSRKSGEVPVATSSTRATGTNDFEPF
jgi:hypothetical protein